MYAVRAWDVGWPGESVAPRWATGAATRVPLPAPDDTRLVEPDLGRVLRARRSMYGRYDASPDVVDLATLLGYAAGTSRVSRVPTANGPGRPIRLRTYPSAGARYAVRPAVVARSVTGLAPAVYAYEPDDHALLRVGPLPSDADLMRSSPMFGTGDGTATIDATSLPALICLVGELTYEREKYGIRAYRLLLLECGHLAENLVLVATAMGLATVPLAAFHDDATNRLVLADGTHESVLYVLPIARATAATVTAPATTDSPVEPA
jgi:SagB-type dehydrogenase family enzyme